MAEIDLAKLLDIDLDKLHEYKFHLAVKDKKKNIDPFDAFIEDKEKAGEVGSNCWWWQAAYGEGREKYRWGEATHILSFMRFRPEGDDAWLFGGIFQVTGRDKEEHYDVHLTTKSNEWIGRLKIHYHSPEIKKYLYFNRVYPKLKDNTIEILKEPYWITQLR